MDDGAALRAAVRANRGQATPRLVYADWLDDNGDPVGAALQRVLARPDDDGIRLAYADTVEADDSLRASVIRTGIRWRDFPDGPCQPGCPCGGECNTTASVVQWYGDRWNPPLPGEPRGTHWRWRRGFPEEYTCPGDWWVTNADAITDAHPVRRVRLTTTPPYSQHNDHRKRVTAIWFNGREDVRYGVDDREILLARGYSHAAEVMRDAVLGLLRLNWPDIEFELPPVPPRGQLADFDATGAATTFNRAADAAARGDFGGEG